MAPWLADYVTSLNLVMSQYAKYAVYWQKFLFLGTRNDILLADTGRSLHWQSIEVSIQILFDLINVIDVYSLLI